MTLSAIQSPLVSPMAALPFPSPPHPLLHLSSPNRRSPSLWRRSPSVASFNQIPPSSSSTSFPRLSGGHTSPAPSPSPFPSLAETLRRHSALLVHLAAFAVYLVGFGARACAIGSAQILPPTAATASVESSDTTAERVEDEELRAALESWKSKTYALTVPLRIVALRGSIPPSWIKEFIQAQGRRLKLIPEFRGSLESIFSDLSSASKKGSLQPKSAMAADIVSVGDSWLSHAIIGGLIEPMKAVEREDWFKVLGNKWKVYLCRNNKGELDSNGYVWGIPYRWGTMLIAYKKNKFRKHNLRPIEDWGDLWRPELAGKISMVDSPREVVGAVLKHMGASYNTKDIESQVVGGREAVLHNLTMLQRQVRLFDSVHYLKAFGAGNVWVAVGWSSDVIPSAKRMSNVAVVVPKSGTSLWADLWLIFNPFQAIPYAARFATDQIGGRVRSPSPLVNQWLEFCLQTARGLPFQQEVVPGASPFVLEHPPLEGSQELGKGKPKLDTNLIEGIPPPDILMKCEFLEPLSEKAVEDHQWLISSMQKQGADWIRSMLYHVRSIFNPQTRC
ncbi:uncharacterized protein LOC103716646 isoform X2 [Phoenix dactylifera]|uniref:Uncharacterized protein LOC103716646 isoform X2 n=1 Tax=Phoenix dactylifera TaxID=42345 RepID=A0A8B9AFY2_PHODC|nr:uncharacterized protein LOC103716646 isoform X2 [Phoenix dactylifera]